MSFVKSRAAKPGTLARMVRFTCALALLAMSCGSSGSSGGTGGAGGAGGAGASGGSAGSSGSGGSAGTAGSSGNAGSSGSAGSAGGDAATGKPVVEIETSLGTMAIELEPEKMPITTANFLAYVDAGFYSGTIIHRVIPGFVIQGGGYDANLSPKPTNAPIVLETHADLKHVYGAISMARTTDPNSATSQFFVVNGASASNLDGGYAAFGNMIEGNAVLDAISGVATASEAGFDDVPVEDITILSAKRR